MAVSENGRLQTYSAGSISAQQRDIPYYIYSISKSFTATAVMRLCEDQGDFLDDVFCSYFPERTIPKNITIRQLLNHTSGLSDYFSVPEYQRAIEETPTEPWTYEKLMEVGLQRTPLFEAGKKWAYSNPGYGLLKELIELKSGLSYYEYLTEVIIKKANLVDTRPFVGVDFDLELLAAEDASFEGDFRSLYHPGWIATGCFISTVSDVAKFYDALFDGQLVSADSIQEMVQTEAVLAESPVESIPSYGLGLMHFKNSPLGDAYGHGGGGPGYTTYATHFPNLEGNRVSISLVLNRSMPETPFGLADEIIKQYIESHH